MTRNALDPTKLHVTSPGDVPKQPDIERLDQLAGTRGGYHLTRREILLHCPINYGETKLLNSAIEQALGVSATTRNCSSVTPLPGMVKA